MVHVLRMMFPILKGNSLAVQGLGLGAFTARARVRSLVGKLRSHNLRGAGKKKKKRLKEDVMEGNFA